MEAGGPAPPATKEAPSPLPWSARPRPPCCASPSGRRAA